MLPMNLINRVHQLNNHLSAVNLKVKSCVMEGIY